MYFSQKKKQQIKVVSLQNHQNHKSYDIATTNSNYTFLIAIQIILHPF